MDQVTGAFLKFLIALVLFLALLYNYLFAFEEKTIVVIGSGLAGQTAALEILNMNKNIRVVLIEKEGQLGGNSAKASSGINGVNTKAQLAANITDSFDAFYNDTILSGQGLADRKLARLLVDGSEDAINFLQDLGVNLSVVSKCGGHSSPRTHRIAESSNKSAPLVNVGRAITTTLEPLIRHHKKSMILTHTKLTQLILDGTQRKISSVRVEVHGSEMIIAATAVVLATGGYGRDSRLLKEFAAPEVQELPSTNGDWTTGDGIHIARNLHAALIDMDQIQVHPTAIVDPKNPNSSSKFLAPESLRAAGAILLNHQGLRFVDELGLRDNVTQAIFENCAPLEVNNSVGPKTAYLVFNQEVVDKFGPSLIKFYQAKGFVKVYENARDLAKQHSFPLVDLSKSFEFPASEPAPTAPTAEVNSLPSPSVDGETPTTTTVVTKPTSIETLQVPRVAGLPVFAANERVYVIMVTPAIHYTMGGLKINQKADVMRQGDQRTGPVDETIAVPLAAGTFEGIFAAGEVTGGVHGKNRLAGNSLLECVVFGRLAGRSAVEFLESELERFKTIKASLNTDI